MKVAEMQDLLNNQDDFALTQSIVGDLCKEKGHRAKFIPKFHCEFNGIKMAWGESKRTTQKNNNRSIIRLQTCVSQALDSVSLNNMRKYLQHSCDYMRA